MAFTDAVEGVGDRSPLPDLVRKLSDLLGLEHRVMIDLKLEVKKSG